jgi:hypothetical protein
MEDDALLHEHNINWITIKIPSTGLRHYTGIASSYAASYPEALRGILTNDEFVDILSRLNETIRDYWPCNTCYLFGYGCCLCTFGLSVLIPSYCITHAETNAIAMLKNVTLKARFYDKHISFHLVKGPCSSYIEIRYPSSLQLEANQTENAASCTIATSPSRTPAVVYNSPGSVFTTEHPSRLKKS